MYRNSYQRGLLTILNPGGAKPFELWDLKVQDGCVSTFLDPEIKAMVLDIRGNNVSTCYMLCPKGKKILGICMPFLVMIVKNLKKYFSFEITILDDTGVRRRFRVSNFQSTTKITFLCTAMPLSLSNEWNRIQFNLADFTRRAYNKSFMEVQNIKINANIRIRKIYFADQLMPDEDLPPEYKIYFGPTKHRPLKTSKVKEDKENQPELKNTENQVITAERKGSKENVITPTKTPSLQETLIEEVTSTPVADVAIVVENSATENLCECEPPANGAALGPCECNPVIEADGPVEDEPSVVH